MTTTGLLLKVLKFRNSVVEKYVVKISNWNYLLWSTVIKGEDWTNHFILVHNPGVLLEPLRESEVAGPECIIRSLAAKED